MGMLHADWFDADFWQRVVISGFGTLGSLLIAMVGFFSGSRQSKRELLRGSERARLARAVTKAETFFANYTQTLMTEMTSARQSLTVDVAVALDFVTRLNDDIEFNYLVVVSGAESPEVTRIFIEADKLHRDALNLIVADVERRLDAQQTTMAVPDYWQHLYLLSQLVLVQQVAVAGVELSFTGVRSDWRSKLPRMRKKPPTPQGQGPAR